MSTSIHDGIIEFADSLYGAGADPLDTTIVRDGLANGLLHCADECGQVRVNYVAPAAAIAGEIAPFETIESSPVADTWYRVGAAPFGPWPLTLHADGTPYKLRVRVGIATSASSSTLTMRIVVCPMEETIATTARDAEADYVYELTWAGLTVGTTPTWTAGTSQGSAASATLIAVDKTTAQDWASTVSTYDAVSAASPVTVQQTLVCAHVWAKTSGAALPRLHALHLSEFVG